MIIDLIERLNFLLIISNVVLIVRMLSWVVGVMKFMMLDRLNMVLLVVVRKKMVIRIIFVIVLSFGFFISFEKNDFDFICLLIFVGVVLFILVFLFWRDGVLLCCFCFLFFLYV